MRHHRVHELLADAPSAVLVHHEHVAEPGERRAIRDHARKADLPTTAVGVAIERAEADRTIERALHHLAGDARGPVRLVVKEPPDQIAIDVSWVARYDALIHVARV